MSEWKCPHFSNGDCDECEAQDCEDRLTERCHVCGQLKKPYTIIMNTNVFSIIKYKAAREDGPICQRCDQYYAMTGEFKNASQAEFENAKKAAEFARLMLAWWEKDEKLHYEENTENRREFPGTESWARWARKYLNGRK